MKRSIVPDGQNQFQHHLLHKAACFRIGILPALENAGQGIFSAAQILHGFGICTALQHVKNAAGQSFPFLRRHSQDPFFQRNVQQLAGFRNMIQIVPVIAHDTPGIRVMLQESLLIAVNHLIFFFMLQQHSHNGSLGDIGVHPFFQAQILRRLQQISGEAGAVIVVHRLYLGQEQLWCMCCRINGQVSALGMTAHQHMLQVGFQETAQVGGSGLLRRRFAQK